MTDKTLEERVAALEHGEPQVVQHITITGDYYQVVYEQAATKGVLGFKVTAQGGNREVAEAAAEIMLARALQKAPAPENRSWAERKGENDN